MFYIPSGELYRRIVTFLNRNYPEYTETFNSACAEARDAWAPDTDIDARLGEARYDLDWKGPTLTIRARSGEFQLRRTRS